ncbi:MAG: DUF6178 family protein [bacterium]|nr:DUF6178 family protein [bacterium]
MTTSNITSIQQLTTLGPQRLARSLVRGDVPEQMVRMLPPQVIHSAIRLSGLESATELFMTLSDEQVARILDFDLWHRDQFSEDNFWLWLATLSDVEFFSGMDKLLRNLDPEILCLLVHRYLDVVMFDEPTEAPPAAEYYTPDRGYTWLGISIEDNDRHVLFARMLAYIVESRPEFFYQLLAEAQAATQSAFEENAYTHKERNLAAEDIPDFELSIQIHRPLPAATILDALERKDTAMSYDIRSPGLCPALHVDRTLEPLTSFLNLMLDQHDPTIVEGEMALILGAAIVFYGVAHYETSEVETMTRQVRGAMNIGLQSLLKQSLGRHSETNHSAQEILKDLISRELDLTAIYKAGLFEISRLRQAALSAMKKIKDESPTHSSTGYDDEKFLQSLAMLGEMFPKAPSWMLLAGGTTTSPEALTAKTLNHLQDLQSVLEKIS